MPNMELSAFEAAVVLELRRMRAAGWYGDLTVRLRSGAVTGIHTSRVQLPDEVMQEHKGGPQDERGTGTPDF